jgi:hypothetical protein
MSRASFFRILFVLIAILGFSVLLFWAPWITTGYAESAVIRNFEAEWAEVVDGCGFNCEGCGVVGSEHAPFGYRVQIEYACGMLPADLPEYHEQADVFVSLFGTVHELPVP